MEDYDGAQVLDADGNAVGTVDRTYVDDGGTAQMVDVKIGNLFAKHRLVPVDQAQATDDGLQVPYIKDGIEESPAYRERLVAGYLRRLPDCLRTHKGTVLPGIEGLFRRELAAE